MHEFLYRVKNLKGILVLPGTTDPEPLIKWLGMRFRNRHIGCWYAGSEAGESGDPTLAPFWKRLQKPPFVFLALPAPLTSLTEQLQTASSGWLSQVFLANLYCTPLIFPANAVSEIVPAEGLVWSCRARSTLSNSDLKFNIRLADYAMTDFLHSLIPGTLAELLSLKSSREVGELLERRKTSAEGDAAARFWRLLEPSSSANAIQLQVVYYDWLHWLTDPQNWALWRHFVDEFPNFMDQFSQVFNLTIALGIEVASCLSPR